MSSPEYPSWYRFDIEGLDTEIVKHEKEWIEQVFEHGVSPEIVEAQVQMGYTIDFVFDNQIGVEIVNTNTGSMDKRAEQFREACPDGEFWVVGDQDTPVCDCDLFIEYDNINEFVRWIQQKVNR